MNRLGRMDAVIHNAGIYTERGWNLDTAYSDSKLHVTALALAFAVARCWPEVLSHAVDPGWVQARMGGRFAPDTLSLGHVTQVWLAVSDDPAVRVSGGYWYHGRLERPAAMTRDPAFRSRLVAKLAMLSGVPLR